ncbi:hypothetical protein GCM10007209_12600 [Haloferax sulfurifontis]|uniref:Uncharacterized protein n=1 Tax=Haloferax sulfurifontis TaxID=255616 RepID=A0A830DUP3_9EURY|nr:hypothetical protein GCM10007209_12600 [Haloferax sulfurifontis]
MDSEPSLPPLRVTTVPTARVLWVWNRDRETSGRPALQTNERVTLAAAVNVVVRIAVDPTEIAGDV